MFYVVDKTSEMNISEGAIYSLVAILMVFAILLIIIGITTLIFKLTGLFEMKKEIDGYKKNNKEDVVKNNSNKEVVITDDNMMAAVLVATIDYQNEIKKDVRVVSVKKVN